MSVLIKGMEMPKCCGTCNFLEFENEIVGNKVVDNYFCLVNFHRLENELIRDKECPLVEIPKKHGELINKDKVTTKINNLIEKFETTSGKCYHPDVYFDTDKSFGRYRAYSYKADGAEAALNEIISAETIIESEE